MFIRLIKQNLSVITVFLSSVLSMVLGFIISLLATFFVESSIYGEYRAVLTTSQVFATLLTFGFHYTIGREIAKDTNSFSKSTFLGVLFSICITLVTQIIISSLAFIVWDYLPIPVYILIAPIISLCTLLVYFFQQSLMGAHKITSYAFLAIAPQAFILALLLIIFLNFSISTYLLLSVYFVSHLIVFSFLIKKIRMNKNTLADIKSIINTNSTYGFQLYLGSLVPVLYSQLIGLLVIPYSGYSEYAYYTLGLALASPVLFIPTSIATVFYRRIVSTNVITPKDTLYAVTLTAVGSLILLAFINYLIPIMISGEYIESIYYANIMIIYYALWGLGDFFIKLLSARGLSTSIRNISFANGIIMIIVSLITVVFFQFEGVIIAKLSSAFIYFISTSILFFFKGGKHV